MKSILDRSFKYTPAAQSTPEKLRAKFRKIIAEQQKPSNIAPIRKERS
jgi:hypothetical protein